MATYLKKLCLTCLLLLVNLTHSYAQRPYLKFEHINTKNGLSNNDILCVLQDSRGFMWFGTVDGLNRWDGHSFKVFRPNPNNSNSLSDGCISCLLEDKTGILWIGTYSGLNRYDPVTETFHRYLNDEADSCSISNDLVYCIYEDSTGGIWIGTPNGLNYYNAEADNFRRYYFESHSDSYLPNWNNNMISAISQDHNGSLLIGTIKDFFRFDPSTGVIEILLDYTTNRPPQDLWGQIAWITRTKDGLYWIALGRDGVATWDSETGDAHLYAPDPSDPYSFKDDGSHCVIEDQERHIWIASNEGLHLFDPKTNRFYLYRHDDHDKYSICGIWIGCIYKDRQGNLWCGSHSNGISKIAKWAKPFRYYFLSSFYAKKSAWGIIRSITEDKDGGIWLASMFGGIGCLNRKTATFTPYPYKQPYRTGDRPVVYGIHIDKYGYIWSYFLGINCLNPKTGIIKLYSNDQSNPNSHARTWEYTLYEDNNSILWFGTKDAGLERFDRYDERFEHFQHDPDRPGSLPSNEVRAVYRDKTGRLWIGTARGFCEMIQCKNGQVLFKRDWSNLNSEKRIEQHTVYDFYEDKSDRFWLATSDGLFLFNRDNGQYVAFTRQYGLPTFDIFQIQEDDFGNLWLFTFRGLIKFDPVNKLVRLYDERDGLDIGAEPYGVYKGKSGEMFCGGVGSLVSFFPDSLKDNPDPPKMVLTNFYIHNKPVQIGGDSPLSKSITHTEIIHLDHSQNMLSFDFAALDYTAPEKNLYAYKMDGVDRDWVYCGNQHSAFYTNLDPGKYVFHAKGTNNDGVWNEEGVSVRIIIRPPWWKTQVAYIFYVCFVVFILVTTWRLQLRRIHLKNDLKIRTFESEKLKEVDRLKSRLFANISHEFRTPITLILDPIEQLIAKTRDKDNLQVLSIMQRNARRLLRLINQLLDLSKFEAGRMQLKTRCENIVPLVNRFVQSFESQAKLKGIELIFEAPHKTIWTYVDSDKLENIIYNLVSNALKFTQAGGTITVTVREEEATEHFINGSAEIVVQDTGSGMSPDQLDKVFDRFYQVDESITREHEGSGVGLALTKELVELHKGEILVSSQLGTGSTFTVLLPLGKNHLKAEEVIEDISAKHVQHQARQVETFEEIRDLQASQPASNIEHRASSVEQPASSIKHRVSSNIILIVEDNRDLRTYIGDIMKSDYRVKEAPDGERGLRLAFDIIPDLIISDVMMPGMDGIELCKRLKTDECTSHIPVILLTARAGMESKLEGLETGADDYIIKPFETKELIVRVKNLIDSRRTLRERFSKELTVSPSDITVTSTDEKFLQRAIEIVEQHIDDSDFKTENLSWEVGMSRSQLHRKLRALTDQSTTEFIRILRLKRAAYLFKQHSGNITEIAYQVGFNKPSYFTECLRKQFGLLPSEYVSRHS
jgi:signal transduction histidine kinase/ligand-binding sensor domain-containing protein/DNA-binding response OmpR family regulator